jgi:hypothetical protein
MKHTFLQTAAQPLDELALCRWIGQAAPGDMLEYHRGFLALDTALFTLSAAEQKTLRLLARRARWAAEHGFVHLVQRRIGPGVFANLAIKRPRGFVSPPAIDPDGGEVGDLRCVSSRAVA